MRFGKVASPDGVLDDFEPVEIDSLIPSDVVVVVVDGIGGI
jgi:hypothetical protein